MERCAVFIDGGYLEKIQGELDNVKIDYVRMIEAVCGNLPLLRVYYYNCLPYQPPQPSDEDRKRIADKQRFFNTIGKLPYFTVREGKLAKRGRDSNGVDIFEQKRVDVYLATDLVMHATKRLITHALLFAGDSDFIPAIEIAKTEGVSVQLYSVQSVSARPHEDLLTSVDRHVIIPQSEFLTWRLQHGNFASD